MKRSFLILLLAANTFLNADNSVTFGNFTFTFPVDWGDGNLNYDIGGPTPHSLFTDASAVRIDCEEGLYSRLDELIGSQFSDPQISPTHTLGGEELTAYLDNIIEIISNRFSGYYDFGQYTTLINNNGIIVRKFDGYFDSYTSVGARIPSRILIYIFLDDNSAVTWAVDVDAYRASEYTLLDIQHLDQVAQNASTTRPKKVYRPVITYTEEEYNAVVATQTTAETARDTAIAALAIAEAERDARPTQAAFNTVVAERDARLTETEVRDLRLGSRMLKVVDGNASINIELESTDNLGITNPTWTPVPESKVIIHPNYLNDNIRVDVKADDESNSGVKFFRFKMDGSNSSIDDIKLSIGETEYDRNAIIEALAEHYGAPASELMLSLPVSGG